MEKSSNLMFKARELLATPNTKILEIVVNHLFMPEETIEYQTAVTLYDFCIAHFPNCLTLMLLKVYLSNSFFRFRSIDLLSVDINNFRNRRFEISVVALDDIKAFLLLCLTIQEPKDFDIKLLRRILSFVAYDVLKLQNQEWDKLSECIFSLANIKPLKAFHFFIDLPPVYEKFISKFMQKIAEEAEKVLQNPKRVEDWSLALVTIVKLGIQAIHTEMSFDKIKNLRHVLVNSAKKLIEKGMEQFLLLGLEDLEKFLSKDKYLYKYNTDQCRFVSSSMDKIQELETRTKVVTTKINLLIRSSHNPGIKLSQGEVFDHLNILQSLEILRAFALTNLEESYGEIAIKRLNVILSDHISKKVKIDISVIRVLQPLLITCLMKQGISDNVFKLLGEVVYQVAKEIMNFHNETWDSLREYIVSHCRTQFKRAIYIFQCLAMPLKEEFLKPVMEILLPQINKKLNPPCEVLVGVANMDWVTAFVGGFCAIIHLLEITSYVEYAEVIAHKMVDSVKEIVERDMEVMIAFRDVENIVMKLLEFFGENEYKFVKGLVGRLCEIEGMSNESKIVLWRIHVIIKGGAGMVQYWIKQDLNF